jgi:poly-gamma-glutamate synthesis protein (capsule biosynthesis protein)
VVVAGGDVALGGNVTAWLGADKSYDPLAGLRPAVEEASLQFASLVSPISAKPALPGKGVAPIGPPGAADALARAHLNLVAIASDQMLSSGLGPFTDTLANLTRAGVMTAGARTDATAKLKPVELRLKGWSVAFFAVATWPEKAAAREGRERIHLADPSGLAAAVREARPHYDLVLVSHHGGPDSGDTPTQLQLDLARAAVDAGADAVFDHRAHVPLGIGWISGRPVFYGLGNLVGEEDPKDPWTGRSFVARVTFLGGDRRTVEVCPYLIVDSEPKLFSGANRAQHDGIFRRSIKRLAEPLGGTETSDPDRHSCLVLKPPTPVSDSTEPQ